MRMRMKIGLKKPCTILILLFLILLFTNAQGAGEPDLSVSEDNIYFSKMNPGSDEEITIYAVIYNAGSKANAIVKFYESESRLLIGEDAVVVEDESSTVAHTPWQPTNISNLIIVSIGDVEPFDSELNNNEINVEVEFNEEPSVLVVKNGVATVEEKLERTIPIEVMVYQNMNDVKISVIYDSELEVSINSPSQDIKVGQPVKFYLKVKATRLAGNEIYDNKTILIQASNSEFQSNIAELKVSIHPPVTDSSWWGVTAATAAGTAGILAVIGSTEVGKYKFLSFLFPLYTKLKKEKVLDHYTRGKIHGYILANPGDHYNSIRKTLNISNSTFSYHLQVLERWGVIKSSRDGVYKRFYPSDMKVPDNGGKLKESQRLIIKKIRETPGISQKDIASFLGVSSSTVNYHLQELIKNNIVHQKRMGMKVRYFLARSDG